MVTVEAMVPMETLGRVARNEPVAKLPPPPDNDGYLPLGRSSRPSQGAADDGSEDGPAKAVHQLLAGYRGAGRSHPAQDRRLCRIHFRARSDAPLLQPHRQAISGSGG